jgi:hypothetical protein
MSFLTFNTQLAIILNVVKFMRHMENPSSSKYMLSIVDLVKNSTARALYALVYSIKYDLRLSA